MIAPARRRVAVTAALASVLLLAGCGDVDAGSGAEAKFIVYMAGAPGVLSAEGFMSNNLPFSGSGDLLVELDETADEETLDSALDRAGEFPVPSGVEVHRLVTRMNAAAGEDSPAGEGAYVRIETLWGNDTDGVAGRALAVAGVPELVAYEEELEDVYGDDPEVAAVTITVSATAAEPCAVVDAVAQAAGIDASNASAAQGDGRTDEELACS